MGKYLKLYETENQFDQNEGNSSSVAIMYKSETVNVVNPDLDNHPSRQRVSVGVRNGEIVAMCGENYKDYDQTWNRCYDGTDICFAVGTINDLGLPTSQLNVSNGDHICFEFSVGQVPGETYTGVTAVSSYKCILTGETGKTAKDEYRDAYYKVLYKEGDSTQRLYAVYRIDAGFEEGPGGVITNKEEVYEVLNGYETYDNASLTGNPIGYIFKMENEDIINGAGKVVTSVVPGVAYTDDEKNVYYNGNGFHVTVNSYAEVENETSGNREMVLVETAVYDSPDVDMLTLFGPAMDYYVEHKSYRPESGPYGPLVGIFTSDDINSEEEGLSEGLRFGGCVCCYPTKEEYMSAIIGNIYNDYSSMYSYNALTQRFRPSANGKTFNVLVEPARC